MGRTEGGFRQGCLLNGVELDECEPAVLSVHLLWQPDLLEVAVLGEQFLQLVLGGLEGEVLYQ